MHPKKTKSFSEKRVAELEKREEKTKHNHLNFTHVRIVGESEEKGKCKNKERSKG